MKKIPPNMNPYKKTNTFNQDSVPIALLNEHSTKPSVWGKIIVIEGELLYKISENNTEYKLNSERFGVVEPEVKHFVKPLGKVKFYVEFYK